MVDDWSDFLVHFRGSRIFISPRLGTYSGWGTALSKSLPQCCLSRLLFVYPTISQGLFIDSISLLRLLIIS